ncbi:trimeric intracellular cation channel family protein [Fulvivirgaceae bacterium PWU4]|uniref:Trimeric intracellular cation channel family protein n=1 Tax=Chryseosolibacter histidini TaxID=2782349 RepID=A0AAP2DRJ1_9BACT|nr:trimeric intracellular cation channel family protein [Chryseosolibacter histidini]MBT1701186.1 trimeric intracellular cation channel family protein [Chryseosolibacter histidini]
METSQLTQYVDFDSTFAAFDLIAVFLFAISGALAAIEKKYDFIGVLVLAFFSGVGGGLIRDAIFIQAGPPKAVTDSKYLIVIFGAFLLSMIFHKPLRRLHRTILLVDAVGLGTYGVVGAHAALQGGLVPLAAILVGVFNATGAGIIRDVLLREEPIIFKPGQFYAGAAIVGTVIYVTLTVVVKPGDMWAALLAIAAAFVIRLLSVKFNWRTRPILKEN